MLNDIKNREDLYLIVKEFYKKLPLDKDLKHFFEKFNDKMILEEHLQTLVDFWDDILFFTGAYKRNAMLPHLELHLKNRIEEPHFTAWLRLFRQSVDENFAGENAETVKSRAESIAEVIKFKTKQL